MYIVKTSSEQKLVQTIANQKGEMVTAKPIRQGRDDIIAARKSVWSGGRKRSTY